MPLFSFLTHPTPDQIDGILNLYRNAGWWSGAGGNAPDMVRRIVAGSHCFLAALDGGRMVGMGRALGDGVSDAYIQDVTVLSECRGSGVGAEIVSRILARLQVDGYGWIGLIAENGTEHLYRRLGFETMPNARPMVIKAS
jgi:aralkylamine N-acetyltransferase